MILRLYKDEINIWMGIKGVISSNKAVNRIVYYIVNTKVYRIYCHKYGINVFY